MDTFHLTRETETDRLKCIYTAWIEAWTADDWTRVRAVHFNHHLLMMVIWCLMSLSTKKYLSFQDNRLRHLIRVFSVCQNSLAIFSRNI